MPRVTVTSGGSGGAPSGSAGGSLAGTYPNPSIAASAVTTAEILDGTILNGDINAAAAIAYSKLALTGAILNADLAGSIAASKLTGTAVTQADSGTVTSAMLATSVETASVYEFAPGCYASIPIASATQNIGSTSAGDARWMRVAMPRSGTISSMSIYIITTGGNVNLFILDTGQANATHTTRTCLARSGNVATAASGSWQTDYNPSLAVTKGNILEFGFAFDGTTAKAGFASNTSSPNGMPNAYLTPDGAGTATGKVTGSILAANVPAAVNGTVTDANMVTATAMPLFIWRIT